LTLFITTESGNNIGTNGTLAMLTFNMVGTGLSPIHYFFQEALTEPDGFRLQTVGYDGYFTNADCGSGNLCKPPVVSFVPPLRPITLRPVSFNATAVSQNPAGSIREYNWTFGNFQDLHFVNSPPEKGAKVATNATFIFQQIGEHEVTLSAQDNFGARAYYTVSIDVFRVWIDLGFSALSIDHIVGLSPGTIVHIVASVINLGVNPENSTLRLSVNNKNMTTAPITDLGPERQSSLSFDWNTGNYTPRVYRIEADIDPVRSITTGQFLENDTTTLHGRIVDLNNVRVAFVQLIEPLPSVSEFFSVSTFLRRWASGLF
jgi:hypothetical protein